MCNGEIMGKDHTLEFVYMTRWRIKVRETNGQNTIYFAICLQRTILRLVVQCKHK